MARISNNKSNELGLWEELIRKLRRLEDAGGMFRLHAEFWGETGASVTVPDINGGTRIGYTIYLNPYQLRVTWGHGNGPHQPKPFDITRRFLRHVIAEVEEAIVWEEHYLEQRTEDEERWETERCSCGHKRSQHHLETEHCTVPGCGCPYFGADLESWETHTIVNVGDGPGGFRIVE